MIDLLRDEKILFRVLCRCRPIQFRYSFNTASVRLQMPDSPRLWTRIRGSPQRGRTHIEPFRATEIPKRLPSRKPRDVHSNIRRVYSRLCFPRFRGDRFREAIQQRQPPRRATSPERPLLADVGEDRRSSKTRVPPLPTITVGRGGTLRVGLSRSATASL